MPKPVAPAPVPATPMPGVTTQPTTSHDKILALLEEKNDELVEAANAIDPKTGLPPKDIDQPLVDFRNQRSTVSADGLDLDSLMDSIETAYDEAAKKKKAAPPTPDVDLSAITPGMKKEGHGSGT